MWAVHALVVASMNAWSTVGDHGSLLAKKVHPMWARIATTCGIAGALAVCPPSPISQAALLLLACRVCAASGLVGNEFALVTLALAIASSWIHLPVLKLAIAAAVILSAGYKLSQAPQQRAFIAWLFFALAPCLARQPYAYVLSVGLVAIAIVASFFPHERGGRRALGVAAAVVCGSALCLVVQEVVLDDAPASLMVAFGALGGASGWLLLALISSTPREAYAADVLLRTLTARLSLLCAIFPAAWTCALGAYSHAPRTRAARSLASAQAAMIALCGALLLACAFRAYASSALLGGRGERFAAASGALSLCAALYLFHACLGVAWWKASLAIGAAIAVALVRRWMRARARSLDVL